MDLEDARKLEEMLQELKEVSQAVGLKINLQKTKIMRPNNMQVTIDNYTLERVNAYVYIWSIISN